MESNSLTSPPWRDKEAGVYLTCSGGQMWQLRIKRVCDLLVAILSLIFLLPVFGVIAVLIKLDSPGAVFHVQERLGLGGKLFKCYKLRTMHVGADDALEERLRQDPQLLEEWLTYRKLRNDPRVTRIGRWLRMLTIDEMPQLINVILGEMSIVGPRPYLPSELNDVGVNGPILFSMRPGMAGVWVAQGRNRLTLRQRVELETAYVCDWSLWLDCRLFVASAKAVLLRQGAH